MLMKDFVLFWNSAVNIAVSAPWGFFLYPNIQQNSKNTNSVPGYVPTKHTFPVSQTVIKV